MKNIYYLTIIFICVISCNLRAQIPTPPQGKKWQKVEALSDEFNAGFDENKWEKVLWDYPNTPTKMIARNSGVSDGSLWIKATLNNNSQRWFHSSRVSSKAQIKFPMYTESRIITAHLSAYNTFWLNNGNIDNRDEIDIIENNSRPSCGCQPNFPWQMNSQYFQVVNSDTERNKGNFDNRKLSSKNPKRGVRWNEEYHVVGMWWKDSNNIQFYLDGEPAGSVKTNRPLTRNLNLIWDLWTDDENFLGGVAIRNHLLNNNINTMKVDYVRTYRLTDDPNVGDGNSINSFYIRPVKSNKWVAPINGSSSNGANIVNHPNGNGNAKLWTFVDKGNGYLNIRNVRSGRCLAVPAGNTENGVKLVQWNCNENDDQQWKRIDQGNGQFTFRNKKTGKCMDLTGGNTANNVQMQQWDCDNNNPNQRFWILNSNNRVLINEIHFGLYNKVSSGGVITYPNPASNTLNIAQLPIGIYHMKIINSLGQVVWKDKLKVELVEDNLNIDINGLKSGLYSLFIGTDSIPFIKQ